MRRAGAATRRRGAVILAGVVLALGACSSGGGEGATATGGDTLDVDALDACALFTPAEVESVVQANLEAFSINDETEITSVADGVPDDSPIGDCMWEVDGLDHRNARICREHLEQNNASAGPGDCPPATIGLFVRINLLQREAGAADDTGICLVLHRGVCVSAGMVDDEPFVMPEAAAAAVRARIDASA